jgi:hypothetical protein
MSQTVTRPRREVGPASKNQERCEDCGAAKVNDNISREAEPVPARRAFQEHRASHANEKRAAEPGPESGIGSWQAENTQGGQGRKREQDAGDELQERFQPEELLHVSDPPRPQRSIAVVHGMLELHPRAVAAAHAGE